MSAVWLIHPASPRPASAADAGIVTLPVGDIHVEGLAARLAGHEIVLSCEIPLGAALLARCRWIRGIIGPIGPDGRCVDFAFAKRAGMLVERVSFEPGLRAEENVLTAYQRMERRLRALDDIAERWEGT